MGEVTETSSATYSNIVGQIEKSPKATAIMIIEAMGTNSETSSKMLGEIIETSLKATTQVIHQMDRNFTATTNIMNQFDRRLPFVFSRGKQKGCFVRSAIGCFPGIYKCYHDDDEPNGCSHFRFRS